METCGVDHALLTVEADVAVLALDLGIGNRIVGVALHDLLVLDLH